MTLAEACFPVSENQKCHRFLSDNEAWRISGGDMEPNVHRPREAARSLLLIVGLCLPFPHISGFWTQHTFDSDNLHRA